LDPFLNLAKKKREDFLDGDMTFTDELNLIKSLPPAVLAVAFVNPSELSRHWQSPRICKIW
jgi:hypothetical protein